MKKQKKYRDKYLICIYEYDEVEQILAVLDNINDFMNYFKTDYRTSITIINYVFNKKQDFYQKNNIKYGIELVNIDD